VVTDDGGTKGDTDPQDPGSGVAGHRDGSDGGDEPEENLDRVLTVPNLITLARLLCLPYYLHLLLVQDNPFAAAALLGALGATDWVDGYVARHFNQRSNVGRLMDPTVDRVLFFVGIGGIIAVGAVPLWFCLAVLIREAVVATITVVLTFMGVEPVEVTWFGKAGTFCLMFAFPLLLAGSSDVPFAWLLTLEGVGFAIPGLIFSYYAAFLYIPRWIRNYQLHVLARATAHGSA